MIIYFKIYKGIYNNLNDLDLYSNKKLKYLRCSKNQITKLNLSNNKQLNQLYYDSNVKILK